MEILMQASNQIHIFLNDSDCLTNVYNKNQEKLR